MDFQLLNVILLASWKLTQSSGSLPRPVFSARGVSRDIRLILRETLISLAHEKGSVPISDEFGTPYRFLVEEKNGYEGERERFEEFIGCLRVG
jgi:hypothetical protein